MSDTKIIKKYKNRRIYDTDISRYITFDTLKDYIDQQIDFTIVDSSSGQDITSTTLLQLLVENQQNQSQIIPKQLLLSLIRFSEHPMHDYLNQVLVESMKFYQKDDAIKTMQGFVNEMTSHTQKMAESWQEILTPSKDDK